MALISDPDTAFLQVVSRLAFCNPFLPERIELEREALGDEHINQGEVWSMMPDTEFRFYPNNEKIDARTREILAKVAQATGRGEKLSKGELDIYEEAAMFVIYNRFQEQFMKFVERAIERGSSLGRVDFFDDFATGYREFMNVDKRILADDDEIAHTFACFYQIRRAFHHTYRFIVGGSMPIARLRAAIWQSVFTHDMRRYRRALFNKMGDVTTLVTGASGTGKEIVASAIGLSRYVPFDPRTKQFSEDFVKSFYPLNLSALPSTLIESELFGHRKGAFTGAWQSRVGWLETCPPLGTIFLDEIGELEAVIQVKLLRVLQERSFTRVGESEPKQFHGKIVAATNRNLAEQIKQGKFREDFFYRLCADTIQAPSLQDQLADAPDDLDNLVLFIARRIVGEEEADAISREVIDCIRRDMPSEYAWPGNVRELEQCIRNVVIRGSYSPTETGRERKRSTNL